MAISAISISWCRDGLVCIEVFSVPSCFLNNFAGEKRAVFYYVLAVVRLLVLCVSSSWCGSGLVCNEVSSVLSCF